MRNSKYFRKIVNTPITSLFHFESESVIIHHFFLNSLEPPSNSLRFFYSTITSNVWLAFLFSSHCFIIGNTTTVVIFGFKWKGFLWLYPPDNYLQFRPLIKSLETFRTVLYANPSNMQFSMACNCNQNSFCLSRMKRLTDKTHTKPPPYYMWFWSIKESVKLSATCYLYLMYACIRFKLLSGAHDMVFLVSGAKYYNFATSFRSRGFSHNINRMIVLRLQLILQKQIGF